MAQNRHKGCIQNVRSFKSSHVDSDHYLVISKFITRLLVHWRENKEKPEENYCIEKLAEKRILN